ncbi:N-acetylmuramoyl-L-alanine amidase [Kitasatospora sp. NPDC048540]|uniref:peptidoglycan recognition protein family protein n=1 Tax=Kitasatospora sp. NPDC048540 TaxID=3155634 RepID=UPI003404864F
MSVNVISRAAWGAKPWNGTPNTVAISERTEFFVHYDGATPITRTGNSIPQAIEREHLANGWSGVGYNFVVDQAGNVYEGRGWNLQGAHCPNHNRSGIGVQVAVGGDQAPSEAALAATRALYDEACDRANRTLAKMGHKDGFATDCPGPKLYAWVKAGMPVSGGAPAPAPAPNPSALVLRRGDKGEAVSTLQALLNVKGLARLNVDGDFGPATEEAVKAAQRAVHVAVDGVWGPQTAAGVAAYSRLPIPTAVLGVGSSGQAVRDLQTWLNARGYGHLSVDGAYGPATKTAVIAAQHSLGVTADGVWGPKSAAAASR